MPHQYKTKQNMALQSNKQVQGVHWLDASGRAWTGLPDAFCFHLYYQLSPGSSLSWRLPRGGLLSPRWLCVPTGPCPAVSSSSTTSQGVKLSVLPQTECAARPANSHRLITVERGRGTRALLGVHTCSEDAEKTWVR